MTSQRKLDSARANGAKSRGPVTPEGRQKSSMNSLKHGLTAETLLVDGENPGELERFVSMTVDYFQPQNDFESELVLDLASLRWRLRRVAKIETGLFDKKQDSLNRVDPSYADATGHERMGRLYLGIEKSLDLLTRYETRLQRRYNQALANLLKLRAEKKNARNEPNPKSGHQDYVKTTLDHSPAPPSPASPEYTESDAPKNRATGDAGNVVTVSIR